MSGFSGESASMLPKTAEYALRAAVCLARDPKKNESADRLSEETQIPRRYLHKVLQDLAQAGLVRSQAGPGGGYALARSPEEISILDVVNAVGPLERIRSCPLGLPSHTTLCPLHSELDKAYGATEEAFSRVTLGMLLDSADTVIPLCNVPLPSQASNPAGEATEENTPSRRAARSRE